MLGHMLLRMRRAEKGEFSERMRRARQEGAFRGAQEGKLYRMAVGKGPDRSKALDWLGNAIDEGRTELVAQHASEREIEAWDMACRIAFLLELI